MTDAQESAATEAPEQPETDEAEALHLSMPVDGQLRDAEQILDQLMDAPEGGPIVIDAEGVETMSSAMVLVLASAAASRPEGAPKIAIQKPTDAFTEAFKDLGMFKNLMSMEFRT